MRPSASSVALLAGVLSAACAGRTASQARATATHTAPVPAAAAAVGRDWLDVLFPPLALGNTGCRYTSVLPSGEARRWYQWRVTADFPDRAPANNHFMGVYVAFSLPDTVPLTDVRLDSALAAARITVDEARGEPPLAGSQLVPASAWARREGDRVRLRVEGRSAVRAFLRARTDSVDVGWCQRDEFLTSARVPLERR